MEKYPHEDFGKRFSVLIDESQIKGKKTLERLSRLFGCSKVTVYNWRTGEKLPSMLSAIRIASKLDVCVEYLLTGRGPKRPTDVGVPLVNGSSIDIGHLSPSTQIALRALVHSIQEQGSGQQKKVADD